MLTSKPDFIIIGAMKSATSTLHKQLSLQPGVWMSEPKEPNFFSDDDIWSNGLKWYSRLFDGAGQNDIRGESSTHYTKLPEYPETLERMRIHIPNAKLIYVMRHPIDRLISHFVHEWLNASFEGNINEAVDQHPELIDYGRYAMQLSPFLKSYGPQNVLPVFFERLTKHPQEELERICEFLGYQGTPTWTSALEAQNVSSDRLRVNPLRDKVLDFPPFKYVRQNFIPKSVRNRAKKIWKMNEKPALSREKNDILTKVFNDDLSYLGQWLGTDLNCCNFKQRTEPRVLAWDLDALESLSRFPGMEGFALNRQA